MGTVVSFQLPGAPAPTSAALGAACAELHRIDEVFSTFKPTSVISRLRRGELPADQLPSDVREVLARCASAKKLTDGWFDPWAIPGGLDPSGLVKGWAIERAAARLRAHGVRSALINGGGDIVCFGTPPGGGAWRIGIRHPWRADALAAIIECDGGALATSGTYERGEHLIDPHTGRPRAALASASVIGPDLAQADALATALAVAGPDLLERVEALPGYEAHLVAWNGVEHTTRGVRLVDGGPGAAQDRGSN
jgi:thiamine biosynthesis lipoprotein